MKDQNSKAPAIDTRRPGIVKGGLVPTSRVVFTTPVFHPTSG